MFEEVFGGGKADLVLLDENDVLESGIDIVARPPGKQLQTISLLSGGEQTMTAVALLFSIYQVKPSPFCVLDELDAPLDESNINRFIRVLQRFLEHSQFIIITHNKRTIGMADVLYGVTMQEHGISKIDSVTKYAYDANGNVTQRISGTLTINFTYDYENRLTQAQPNAGSTVSYVYDGDGKVVKRTVGAVTTVLIGSYYELTSGVSKTHYYAGGVRAAVRDGAPLRSAAELLEHLLRAQAETAEAEARRADEALRASAGSRTLLDLVRGYG